MSETTHNAQTMAAEGLASDKALLELVGNLSGSSRRMRQMSAAALGLVVKENPGALKAHIAPLIDALNRPEAQTRWECLDVLRVLVECDSRACEAAAPGAEAALFDEDSGAVRLAAMRFLCRLGSTAPGRSEKLWPFIDEGIQCFHGDLEFQDMLVAVVEFSAGKISAQVKGALAERMGFDAENGKGALKRRAQAIIDNVS